METGEVNPGLGNQSNQSGDEIQRFEYDMGGAVGIGHAVYLLGAIWRINAFDQWGVEEGKRLAIEFRSALDGAGRGPDPSLGEAIAWIPAESRKG